MKGISFFYFLKVAFLVLAFHPPLSWALSDEQFRSDPDILWFGEEYLPAHPLGRNVVEDAQIHRAALQDVATRERLFKVIAKLSENGKGEQRGSFETAVAVVALGRPKEAVTMIAPLLERFPKIAIEGLQLTRDPGATEILIANLPRMESRLPERFRDVPPEDADEIDGYMENIEAVEQLDPVKGRPAAKASIARVTKRLEGSTSKPDWLRLIGSIKNVGTAPSPDASNADEPKLEAMKPTSGEAAADHLEKSEKTGQQSQVSISKLLVIAGLLIFVASLLIAQSLRRRK